MCFVLLQIQVNISKHGNIPLHSVMIMRINSNMNLIEQVLSKRQMYNKMCNYNCRDMEVTGNTKI